MRRCPSSPSVHRPDLDAARSLSRRYALALGVIAALIIAGQVVVQIALNRQRTDGTIINLAGRQRMLSQRLCKAALAWRDHQDPSRLAELRMVQGKWTQAHQRLTQGNDLAHAGRDNSPAAQAALGSLSGAVAAMDAAATALPGDTTAVDRLLAAEGAFLAGMEQVVGIYESEAARRVTILVRLELALCGLLLFVLALEAVVVFRPAMRRLRLAIAERERLRARETVERELAVAAQVARGIGQDLHDGLGQTLTALSLQAASLAQVLNGSARAQADALARDLGEAIGTARALARRLSPVDIQAAGLEGALRGLVDATARSAGIICRLSWPTDGAPPAALGDDLFRIAQEAITNALRHGRATHIAIEVRCGDGAWHLRIDDDGQAGAAASDGLGLRSMRDRALRLGGHLAVGPRPEGGWSVRIDIPAPREIP